MYAAPYFLARDANGVVWRVDISGQSRIAVSGAVLQFDQYWLAYGLELPDAAQVVDFASAQYWLDSIPIVVA